MLLSLELQNFKKHEALKIDFPAGLTLIQGGNYQGKSSILHGILYALWGYTAVPGGKSVAVMKGKKSASATLKFRVNGNDYKVFRKGGNAVLEKDGMEIAKSQSAVTAEISNILGMDRKQFSNLKYSAQKQTEQLLTLGAGELHAIIEDVSGANLVSSVISAASRYIAEDKAKLSVLPPLEDIESRKMEVQRTRKEIHEIKGRKNVLAREIKKMEERIQDTESLVARLEEENRTISEARNEYRKVWDRIREIKELRKQKGDAERRISEIQAEIQVLQEELKRSEGEYLDLRRKADRKVAADRAWSLSKRRLSQASELLGDAVERLNAMPAPKDEDKLLEDYNLAKERYSEISIELNNVRHMLEEGVCKACKRPFDNVNVEDLQSRIDDLTEKAVKARDASSAALKAYQEAVTNNKQRYKLERDVETYKKEVHQHENAIIEAEKMIKEVQDVSEDLIESSEAEVGKLKSEISRLNQDMSAHRATCLSVQRAEQELPDLLMKREELQELSEADLHDTDAMKSDLVTFREALQLDTETYQYLRQKEATLLEGLKHMEDALEKAEETNNRRLSIEKHQEVLTRLVKFLRDNRDRFMSRVWDGIMTHASRFASACTGGEITAVVRNDSGQFRFVENGKEMPIDAASGAQRSIMGLGVQLALARMLPSGLDCLMLDEPTADLDPEHALTMATLLGTEQGQIIMVSHRQMESAVAEKVVLL